MPGRKYAQPNSKYRYGFNGKENDNEVKGEGNQQDYGFRIYDPRLGKFLSVDPLTDEYPELTPYQFAGNTPIQATDLDGLEPAYHYEDDKGRLIMMPAGDNLQRRVPPEHLKYLPQASKDDGSTMRAISTTLDFIPVVGTIKGGIEGIAGYNMEGDKLSTGERLLGVIPYLGKAKKVIKIVRAADKVADANKVIKNIVKSEKVVAGTEKAIVTENKALSKRAGLRKGTKEEVKAAAPTTKDGRYIDPNTKQPIEPGQEVFGHKKGKEWNKYQKDPANKDKTRKEVLDDQNDSKIYQIEDKKSNASHKFEEKKGG